MRTVLRVLVFIAVVCIAMFLLGAAAYYTYIATAWLNGEGNDLVRAISVHDGALAERVAFLAALAAATPVLALIALLFFLKELPRPTPESLRAEADALERFREQRRRELLVTARATRLVLPRRR